MSKVSSRNHADTNLVTKVIFFITILKDNVYRETYNKIFTNKSPTAFEVKVTETSLVTQNSHERKLGRFCRSAANNVIFQFNWSRWQVLRATAERASRHAVLSFHSTADDLARPDKSAPANFVFLPTLNQVENVRTFAVFLKVELVH